MSWFKTHKNTDMKRILILMTWFSLICATLSAQNNQLDWNGQVMKAFSDTIRELRASYFAYHRMWDDPNAPSPRWIKPNPYCCKLFVPPTYYVAPVEQNFMFHWTPRDRQVMNATDSIYAAMPDSVEAVPVPKFEMSKVERTDRWINQVLLKFYLQHPEMVMGNELYYSEVKILDDTQAADITDKNEVKKYMKVDDPVKSANAESEILIVKPNFWRYKGKGKIQFTQHGVSDNWYKGGESTNALYSELLLSANYDDKHRIQFENMMEIKLGFITAPSDTVHEYKTNADKFRLYSKLGVKAFERWYYTLTGELNTQFFPNYKTNSNDLVSNFLSPLELKLTLGMDYKLSKKTFSLSVLGSPFTYKYVYLKDNDLVNTSSFEVRAGEHHADLFGSELTAKLNWKIRPNITWDSKLEYFTTYEKVTINWENTFEFKVNRYFSANIFLHPRFDDGVILSDDNRSYFQFKEMLTFGLSYEW